MLWLQREQNKLPLSKMFIYVMTCVRKINVGWYVIIWFFKTLKYQYSVSVVEFAMSGYFTARSDTVKLVLLQISGIKTWFLAARVL